MKYAHVCVCVCVGMRVIESTRPLPLPDKIAPPPSVPSSSHIGAGTRSMQASRTIPPFRLSLPPRRRTRGSWTATAGSLTLSHTCCSQSTVCSLMRVCVYGSGGQRMTGKLLSCWCVVAQSIQGSRQRSILLVSLSPSLRGGRASSQPFAPVRLIPCRHAPHALCTQAHLRPLPALPARGGCHRGAQGGAALPQLHHECAVLRVEGACSQ
jgi:hypothetical protein